MKDDRGDLDLTKTIEIQKSQINGLKRLIKFQKEEIWELKKVFAENEQNKNLVFSLKKLITELSKNVR
jgi:predicted RNase H-like nuclease (RuvC/YqgF family)|tara:strand:- start:637 stop:840 length:204 start_codon:yes stop_codon:yes gene_type:complete